MGRYKTRELAHVGVDYIKCLLLPNNENKHINFLKLKGLSVNSDFFVLNYYGYELFVQKMPMEAKKWSNAYEIRYNNVAVAFIGCDGIAMGTIIPADFIEITGQGLHLFSIEIFYFLMDYFGFNFFRYKRVDFAMDIFVNTNYFWNNVMMKKYKKERTYTPIFKQGVLETVYFGVKDNTKNTYQILRIYDKIKDSVKKEKLFLYHEERKNENGIGYKDVTRFEVEIREDLAKSWDFYDINDVNQVFAKLNNSFFKFNKQFFKFIDFSDFNNYYEDLEKRKTEKKKIMKEIRGGNTQIKAKTKFQEKIQNQIKAQEQFSKYGNFYLSEKEKIMTKKMFLTYAKKLYLNGEEKASLKELIDSIEEKEKIFEEKFF